MSFISDISQKGGFFIKDALYHGPGTLFRKNYPSLCCRRQYFYIILHEFLRVNNLIFCHTRSAKEQVSDMGAVRAEAGSLIGSGNHSGDDAAIISAGTVARISMNLYPAHSGIRNLLVRTEQFKRSHYAVDIMASCQNLLA